LRASTLRWAFSIDRVTQGCSIASPSGIFSRSMIADTRSEANMRSSVVVERQIKTAGAGITLAASTAAQLIVDAP